MDTKYDQLFAWFNRDRAADPLDIKPIRVTRARAAAARQFLQEYSGIDFDAFHDTAKVDALISEPLGMTPACLTAEAISHSVRSYMLDEPFSRLDLGFVNRVVAHVTACEECWDNIELYQGLEQRSLARAYAIGAQGLPKAMWIGPIGGIRQEPTTSPRLEIPVMTYTHRATSAAGIMHLRIACPFESEEVTLQAIDMIPTSRFAKVAAGSTVQSMQDFAVGLYQSSGIAALAKAQIGTCGYVRISQEIEGQLIYSTRVIRFENP